MNGIIGSCELALDNARGTMTREYLTMIHTSAMALLGLVNDILDFSKIAAGKFTFKPQRFSLRTTIENIYDVFHDKVQEKDLEFVVDISRDVPDLLIGDALRLRQIIINLIGNAFKFTETGEIVLRISEQALTREDVFLQFTIKDTGIGIDKHLIASLFDAFVQADGSPSQTSSGTGLGLAICKTLVDMMGGDIQVESQPGQGSMFTFTARFALAPEAETDESANAQRSDLNGLKVLVVDDHPGTRSVISEFVNTFGCQVNQAGSAVEALVSCAAAREEGGYDLILLDQKMEGMSGLDLAAKISSYFKDIAPVMVMISGNTAAIDVNDARKAGIRRVMGKPVKRLQLFDTLSSLFIESETDSHPLEDAPAAEEHDFSGRHVLLVEDNPISQKVAEAVLQSANLTVSTANDGTEALDALADIAFDAVLMDIQMPKMDGYEATRRIRSDLGLKSLPIIAMTAHATQEAMDRCREAGMGAYVSKPIDRQQLFSVLEDALDGK